VHREISIQNLQTLIAANARFHDATFIRAVHYPTAKLFWLEWGRVYGTNPGSDWEVKFPRLSMLLLGVAGLEHLHLPDLAEIEGYDALDFEVDDSGNFHLTTSQFGVITGNCAGAIINDDPPIAPHLEPKDLDKILIERGNLHDASPMRIAYDHEERWLTLCFDGVYRWDDAANEETWPEVLDLRLLNAKIESDTALSNWVGAAIADCIRDGNMLHLRTTQGSLKASFTSFEASAFPLAIRPQSAYIPPR
jgi:hypothetical protein